MPSFWQTVKQLFTPSSLSSEQNTAVGITISPSPSQTFDSGFGIVDSWGSSSGSLVNSSQSINTSVSNGRVSGQGNGQLGKLSGSTFIELAEDLAVSTLPISIKIQLRVGKGQVKVSIRTTEGEIVSDTATPETPAAITGTSEINWYKLRMKLEAVEEEASDVSYQVEFHSL